MDSSINRFKFRGGDGRQKVHIRKAMRPNVGLAPFVVVALGTRPDSDHTIIRQLSGKSDHIELGFGDTVASHVQDLAPPWPIRDEPAWVDRRMQNDCLVPGFTAENRSRVWQQLHAMN